MAECGPEPSVDHAIPANNDRALEIVIHFNCDVGFGPVGSDMITCQTDGQWSPIELQCTSEYISQENIGYRYGILRYKYYVSVSRIKSV